FLANDPRLSKFSTGTTMDTSGIEGREVVRGLARHLGWVGVAITALYIGVIVVLTWGKLQNAANLELNEIGDFLAGVFGPVAILWLILGFIQQGVEIRQNTIAQHLQAEELRNAVAQQKAMAEATQDQVRIMTAELEHNVGTHKYLKQPNIYITHRSTS